MKTYSRFFAFLALLLLGAAPILSTSASAAVDPITAAANKIIAAGKNAAAAVGPAISSYPRNASKIAAKVGAAFESHPDLMDNAPAIALAFTKALLAQGDTPVIRYEIAQSIASLVSQFPGTVQSNQSRITAVLREVATVVKSTDLAVSIAGYVSTALKVSAGNENIQEVLKTSVVEPLKEVIPANDQQRIPAVVEKVNNGQLYTELPPSPTTINNTNNQTTNNDNSSSGGLVTPESPKTNI